MEQGGTQTHVASFDVFDTVLTRRVGEPRAAFLLLGRRLQRLGAIHCSAHAFAAARKEAEVRAFANAGGLDSNVSLHTIYRELTNALHFPEHSVDRLVDAELHLERQLLVVVPSGRDMVNDARRAGHRIVYVSDMYVSSEFLEAVLRDRGLFEEGDQLFVSNEHGASKATGQLWSHVISGLRTSASSIHHIGNDTRSDGRSARRAGCSATVIEENNLNRFERQLEQHAESTDGLASALAGASRIARLDPPDPAARPLSDVAAGVVSPFVIGYVMWLLEIARREGLSALHFVARDGQLLHDVAVELAPKVGYTGRLHYLYGSRQAWVLACADEAARVNALVPDSGDVGASARDLLERFDLGFDDVEDALSRWGFPEALADRPLDSAGRHRLRTMFREDGDIQASANDRSKNARDLVLSYFAQEGVLTSEAIGLVDLGTGSTIYNAFSSIVGTVGQKPPLGFYFGLRANANDVGYGVPLTYVRNEGDRLGLLRTPGLLTMVEMCCTADHGSVLGYAEEDGVIGPVLHRDANLPVVTWGLPVVRETVRRVAAELLLDDDLVGRDAVDLRCAMLEVFNLFWQSPTRAEATAWGAYPFEDGWGSKSFRHPIAKRLPVHSTIARQPYRHWWEQGSARLSGPVGRSLIDSRRTVIDLRDRINAKRARR